MIHVLTVGSERAARPLVDVLRHGLPATLTVRLDPAAGGRFDVVVLGAAEDHEIVTAVLGLLAREASKANRCYQGGHSGSRSPF